MRGEYIRVSEAMLRFLDESEGSAFGDEVRVCALRSFMELVRLQAFFSPSSEEGGRLFRKLASRLLSLGDLSEDCLGPVLKEEFVEEFADLLLFFCSSVRALVERREKASPLKKLAEADLGLLRNALFVLDDLGDLAAFPFSALFLAPAEEEAGEKVTKEKVVHAYRHLWLSALLRYPLPRRSLAKALGSVLPKLIVPSHRQPLLLADLLSALLPPPSAPGRSPFFFPDAEGEQEALVHVLALQSLVTLILRHNLRLPSLYEQLFRLLSPASAASGLTWPPLRSLLATALASPLLPSARARLFLRKMAAIAAVAEPETSLHLLALVLKLARSSPQLGSLLPSEEGAEAVPPGATFSAIFDTLEEAEAEGGGEGPLWEVWLLSTRALPFFRHMLDTSDAQAFFAVDLGSLASSVQPAYLLPPSEEEEEEEEKDMGRKRKKQRREEPSIALPCLFEWS